MKHRDYATVDEYGVDYVHDDFIDAVMRCDVYTVHEVRPVEQFNPMLTALDKYNNAAYWDVILYYNKIPSFWDYTVGLTIKIPSLDVISTLEAIKRRAQERTVTI